MVELGNAHPSNAKEVQQAARAFEQFGEKAMEQSGDARTQSIHQMQDYLKNMKPEERQNFFAQYGSVQAERNSPEFVNGSMGLGRTFSMPYGVVEKNDQGEPTGIAFHEGALKDLYHSVIGSGSNEIHVNATEAPPDGAGQPAKILKPADSEQHTTDDFGLIAGAGKKPSDAPYPPVRF
jgi:hypothetical protein